MRHKSFVTCVERSTKKDRVTMLQFLRSNAGSWIIKILMGLIIISFAAWGIADIFVKDPNATVVASVDGHKITSLDVKHEVINYGNLISKQFGQEFNIDMLKQQGMHRNVVQNLLKEAASKRFAEKFKLRVGEGQVRDSILKNPMFRTEDGQFNAEQFKRFMGMMGKSEAGYIFDTQRRIVQTALSDTLGGAIKPPSLLIDDMYNFKNEKRVAQYIKIPNESMTAPQPTDDELKKYHEEKGEKFMAPEYRSFKLIKLSPKQEADKIQMSDEELKKLYDDNIQEYTRPEKREVDAFITHDIEAAREVKNQLIAKKEPQAIVDAMGKEKVTYNDWGLVTSDDIPEEIKDAVLILPLGEISEPLQTKDGFYITRIKKIEKAGVDSFETVKPHIAEKEKLARATDQLIDKTNKIDEKVSDGVSIEDIAKEMNVPVQHIDLVDNMGVAKVQTEDSKDPTKAPSQEIVQTVFASPLKEVSSIQENTQGEYYVVKVEEIVPKVLKPLDDVKEQVKKLWTLQQQKEMAEKKAQEIVAEIKKGQSLTTLAKANNLEIKTTEEFTRDGKPLKGIFPRNVLTTLFKEKPNGVEMGLSGSAYVVAQLDRIIPIKEKEKESEEKIIKSLESDLKKDIMDQFQEALLKKYNAHIDEEALDNVL
jgi:peptidyl-prolyl cis-trans isomerase D